MISSSANSTINSQMPIIAFCNLKGGVGKSTTAIALAYYLQKIQQKSVVIVDTDAQQSTAQWASFLDIEYRSFTYEEILTDLGYLKADYDYVVVDAPSVDLAVSVTIIERADRIFVPTKPGMLDLNSTGDILKEIEQIRACRSGLPGITVFLSMGRKNSLTVVEAQKHIATDYPHVNLSQAIIYTRSCIEDGFGQRTIVWEMPKTRPVKAAIDDYTDLFCTSLGLPNHAIKKTAHRSISTKSGSKARSTNKSPAHTH